MDKLKMQTMDSTARKYNMLVQLFPDAVSESIDENGNPIRTIDKDVLMREINASVVENGKERYQFTWPGKSQSLKLVNEKIEKTLRLIQQKSVGKYSEIGEIDSENIYIEGDNLDALKLLQETYLERIKAIYIDPPYNTGSDFIYKDNFAKSEKDYLSDSGDIDEEGNRLQINQDGNGRFHTNWLNMIYPRLRLAKDLLSDDGVIFISIDDHELGNLKKICDEIFGEQNFVSNIIWQSTAGSNTGTDIVTVTEYVLVYTKNRNKFTFDGVPTSDKGYNLSDEYESIRGKYSLDKLDRRRVAGHYTDALNYPLEMPDGTIRYPGGGNKKPLDGWNYLWSKKKVEWGIKNGFVVFKQNNGEWNVYNKRYFKVDNEGNAIDRTIPFRNLITSDQFNTAQGTAELRNLFGFRPFDFPKPSEFIKWLLMTAIRTDKNAIVLDFFSGSASTAQAVMQLNAEDSGNRKFIMIQIPEEVPKDSEAGKAGYRTICDIGENRIRRAGEAIKKNTGAAIDYGFRCYKVDSSNMKEVYYRPAEVGQMSLDQLTDNIKEDRTPDDLLIQVMLDLGVLLSSKIEQIEVEGKKVYSVADGYLIACFDSDVTESIVTAIAKRHPFYAVFRDSSMANDSVAVNFEQIFETYSPETVRKVL